MKSSTRLNLFRYIQQLKEEIRKVSWTKRSELFFFTKLVVISTFVFGLGVYLVDLVIKGALDLIGIFFRAVFG